MEALLTILIPLLIQVESGGDNSAVGDDGRAIGCLQIWKICVDDVNRIAGDDRYTYQDRYSRQKSIEMARIYLTHYGQHYEHKTGQKATQEVLARIWNGGPSGYSKPETIKYYEKVKKASER